MPALSEVNVSEQVLDQELSLNSLLAEEATDRARDLIKQNSKLTQDQQQKMSENLAMDIMVSYYLHGENFSSTSGIFYKNTYQHLKSGHVATDI